MADNRATEHEYPKGAVKSHEEMVEHNGETLFLVTALGSSSYLEELPNFSYEGKTTGGIRFPDL